MKLLVLQIVHGFGEWSGGEGVFDEYGNNNNKNCKKYIFQGTKLSLFLGISPCPARGGVMNTLEKIKDKWRRKSSYIAINTHITIL